ncbi:MAG: YraN family protein [Bacteroidales bacterium]|nr:YraN family protein [Bacteroidales bacterium]
MTTKEIGQIGEDAAVNYLISQGYSILERNWRCGHLELDIVALDGDFLAIVEVKTREVNSLLSPNDAITKSKQNNLISAANGYVRRNRRHEEVRFDIVSVIHHNGEVQDVELIKYAFYPSLRTR